MASKEPENDRHEEEETAANEDEDTGAQVAPIVRLEEVAVSTGEEDEDAVLDLKSKLYRFDREGNQWKERGAGSVKLLKHKQTGKVRLVMRQSKTLKICANHLILPGMTVQEHSGNDKSCLWHAPDFAEGELKDELFCIRFASIENCKIFMEKFKEIAESQQDGKESEEGNEAAGFLKNLSVEEKKTDEKGGEEIPAKDGKEETPAKDGKEETPAKEGKEETKRESEKEKEDKKTDESAS